MQVLVGWNVHPGWTYLTQVLAMAVMTLCTVAFHPLPRNTSLLPLRDETSVAVHNGVIASLRTTNRWVLLTLDYWTCRGWTYERSTSNRSIRASKSATSSLWSLQGNMTLCLLGGGFCLRWLIRWLSSCARVSWISHHAMVYLLTPCPV